jgi:uncharacterized protein DUF4143
MPTAPSRGLMRRTRTSKPGLNVYPAWSSGQTHRAVGTPKLAFVDSGIACHLIGQDATRLGEPDGAAGPMLENFVSMEVARQLTWSTERATNPKIKSGTDERDRGGTGGWPAVTWEPDQATGIRVTV